jgi:zinc protease
VNVAAISGLSPFHHVLSNGVRVTIQETAFTPAVTISAAVHAGGLYEPDDLPGLAWFLSRVIDRGTMTRPADAIAEALDDCGVTLKTSVNRHTMLVSCTCLAEDFEELLALVADVVRAPAFPPAEVAKRRAEIVTAIRQDEDNPAVRASEALQQLLYGAGHPYGRPSKGTIESVERISRDALAAFHAARFGPASLSLVIVGDVTDARALECASDAFADWAAPEPVERPVPAIELATTRRRLFIPMADKPQADISYGFVTISRLDAEYYAYWVMNNILGQFGLGGRLAENIRERQGMAYYAYSGFDPSVGPGPLVIRAGVDPRNVDRAVDAIDVEVGALGREGPTEHELAETTQFLIGSIPRLLETNQSIAAFLQTSEFFGLGLDHDRRLPQIIAAVTMDDVRRAAAAVLRPERAAVAIAGPPAGAA